MYVAQERRAYILRLLQQRGSVRSAAMAQELGVTDETIRTDLVALQAQGLLERTHGGARYILPLTQSTQAGNVRLELQLAELAARHIDEGMHLYLDDSPFALALVATLHDKPCTLICCAVDALRHLQAAALPHEIYCPGGRLDKASGLLLPDSGSLRQEVRVDAAILSPTALRPKAAAFPTRARAQLAASAAQTANRVFALVPAAALTDIAPHTVELETSLLFTENALPPGFDDMPRETVPYIAPEDVIREASFDY